MNQARVQPVRLAQLGERLPYKQDVTGSNPVPGTDIGMWLSLARALRLGRRGRGFKSRHPNFVTLPL